MVLVLFILIGGLVGDGPSRLLAVAFVPPTVQHGEVEYAVHQSLLTGSSGSLRKTGGSIHPDVNPRNKMPCQVHVIILKEDDFTQEFRTAGYLHNLLDEPLPGSVVWMGFSCKDKLYGMFLIVHNPRQTIQIGKQKMSSFVSCKAPSEADKKSIRIKLLENGDTQCRVNLAFEPVPAAFPLDVGYQFGFQPFPHVPYLFIGYIINAFPYFLIGLVVHEILIEIVLKQLFPLRRTPSGKVYAIRHIAHMVLFREIAFPERREHLL